MAIGEYTLSREELLQRAQALLPSLRARAEETEKLRQIPQETIDDLKASGLIRVANPAISGSCWMSDQREHGKNPKPRALQPFIDERRRFSYHLERRRQEEAEGRGDESAPLVRQIAC